ncbi:MAG TPA: hypothetical protein VGI45_14585 [Terracidiphilus sp.]|jgi:hypothetical protein
MVRAGSKREICRAFLVGGLCAGTVAAVAQQNPSHSFGPDKCGPADPAYIQTANETGGVPLFLQRSEAGKAMQLMQESTRENVSTLLWASAKLAGAPQVFDIPVDTVTERITFTFSVDTKGSRLELRQPDGQEVAVGSVRTTDTELNCGRLITVEKPQTGNWHAEVTGSGTYWLQAQVQSDIYFIKAEFVEVGGRPGHEGLFRIQGQPIAGEPATLEVSLSASDAKTTEIAFVSTRGDVVEKVRMKVADADREFLELTGEVILPKVPFRVAVVGRDMKGARFQRFDGPLFHAETVQVVPKLDFDEIGPGETRKAAFAIRNLGAARSFKMRVIDGRQFVTSFEPKQLTLGSHETGVVQVEVGVPAGTAKIFEDDLVFVVSSTTGAATSNSAVVKLTVSGNTNRQNAH